MTDSLARKHFTRAKELIALADSEQVADQGLPAQSYIVSVAQVHATLAVAARELGYKPEVDEKDV